MVPFDISLNESIQLIGTPQAFKVCDVPSKQYFICPSEEGPNGFDPLYLLRDIRLVNAELIKEYTRSSATHERLHGLPIEQDPEMDHNAKPLDSHLILILPGASFVLGIRTNYVLILRSEKRPK